jgi:MFS transporter, DHA1 family, solute carrier family 18 (vesicular amine transporter), member 1/2
MITSVQWVIYICEFLTSLSFTILASFYPGLAESKGLPIWLIGFIFSIDPIIGLPISFFVGKTMNKFGRRNFVSIGVLLGACSILLISMLELATYTETIIISVCSRVLAGIGAGFSMTATAAILVIEYKEDIDKVIGYYEAASGLGLLVGPVVGSALYMYDIYITVSSLALFYAIFAALAHKTLTKLSSPNFENTRVSYRKILLKPVKYI